MAVSRDIRWTETEPRHLNVNGQDVLAARWELRRGDEVLGSVNDGRSYMSNRGFGAAIRDVHGTRRANARFDSVEEAKAYVEDNARCTDRRWLIFGSFDVLMQNGVLLGGVDRDREGWQCPWVRTPTADVYYDDHDEDGYDEDNIMSLEDAKSWVEEWVDDAQEDTVFGRREEFETEPEA